MRAQARSRRAAGPRSAASRSPVSRPKSARATPMTRSPGCERRAPGVRFVWIMGADNLSQFHLWRHWREIADLAPILVVDRPGSTLRALGEPRGASPWRPIAGPKAPRRAWRSLAPPAFRLPAWAAFEPILDRVAAAPRNSEGIDCLEKFTRRGSCLRAGRSHRPAAVKGCRH